MTANLENSKAKQIVHLLETTDLGRKEIAGRVGVGQAYVRSVEQRLAGGGMSAADKKYREANPEKVSEWTARSVMRWHSKNRDKMRSYQAKYYAANRDKLLAARRARRVRSSKAGDVR